MNKFLVAGLLTAVAVPVLAQPTAPVAPMAPMAAKIVTRAEIQTMVQTHFGRVDVNRDGFVTSDEMTAMRGKHHAGRPGMAGEPMRDPKAAFDRLDANRDGTISRDEFAKGREVRIEKRVMVNNGVVTEQGQPGAMRMKMRHGGGKMGGGLMGARMLKMADANKDGRVSLQEANVGALQQFDRMDTNRDGRLTPEERQAGRMMMKQMRQAG